MSHIHARRSRHLILWLAAAAAALPACVGADPDPQAPDDPALATTEQQIVVGTGTVTDLGNINTAGDIYRHRVDLLYGGNCVFQTVLDTSDAIPDTTMTLLNVNNIQMAFNDDFPGIGLASRIQMPLVPGTYWVDVRGYASLYTGSWHLSVTCTDSVMFLENFVANGDAGQCGGATGFQIAPMGTWTSNIVIDADGRSGWCEQNLGVYDPTRLLSGLSLSMNFFGNGDANQCKFSGLHTIPVDSSQWPLSSAIGIDTDNRPGGCWQVFSMSGRSDVVLDVEFLANGNAQCGNTGSFTLAQNGSLSFLIDTDNRAGGCTQRFRLRRP